MRKESDILGKRFGKFTVLEFSGKKGDHYTWKCRCDCGNIKSGVFATNLKRGLSKQCNSCALLASSSKRKTHGLSSHKVYVCWSKIKMRCHNPSNPDFPLYGGRGISVFSEWRNNFSSFFDCIGLPPSPQHTIDRIDNNGNYEPGNVRWATAEQQANNTRRSVRISFNGTPITISEASKITGFKGSCIGHYRRKGMNLNEIISLKKK